MLVFSPKRNSQLSSLVRIWNQQIYDRFGKTDKDCFFSFILRVPSDQPDQRLHFCLYPGDHKEDKLKTLWKDLKENNNPGLSKTELLSYIRESTQEINYGGLKLKTYFEIIISELDNSYEPEYDNDAFSHAFSSLLHLFPYQLPTEDPKENNYTCIEHALFHLDTHYNGSFIGRGVEIEILEECCPESELPDFKIVALNKICKQRPFEYQKDPNYKAALTTFFNILNTLYESRKYKYCYWIPIRNGDSPDNGEILGFIQFQAKNRKLREKIRKKYFSIRLDLIHYQLNEAFFNGTLFEIEQLIKDWTNVNLFKIIKEDLAKRIIFSTNPGARNGTDRELFIRYDKIPNELKETIDTLRAIESPSKDGPVATCQCRARRTSDECAKCAAYQEKKLHELLIRLAQIKLQQSAIKKFGSKSAAAAIMARNLDHNLGGHLLSHVTNQYIHWADEGNGELEKLLKLIHDIKKSLLQWMPEKLQEGYTDKFENKLQTVESALHWFLKNNVYLLRYLKQRMDFIATILTFVPSSSTLSFYYDIVGPSRSELDRSRLNPINYDMEENGMTEWTPNTSVKSAGLHHFTPLNFVLNYLAYSERLKGQHISRDKLRVIMTETCKNALASFPGGTIGLQAFYSILENIIRNAAKYASATNSVEYLEFKIDCPDLDSTEVVKYDRNDLIRVTITDNLGNGHVYKKLKRMLQEPIIRESDGELERTHLGLKEMKICAAFLRGWGPETIEKNEINCWHDSNSKAILDVRNAQGNLQYSFFLLKPKEALVVTENLEYWNTVREQFALWGIDVGNIEECKKFLLSSKARYRFILKDNVIDETEFSEQDWLPMRIVSADCAKIANFTPQDMLHEVYNAWLSTLCKEKGWDNVHLVIYPSERVSSQWSRDENRTNSEWQGHYILHKDWDYKSVKPRQGVILYYDHFRDNVNRLKDRLGWAALDKGMVKSNVIHIEAITGGNSSLRKIENDDSPPIVIRELIEAGLAKVLIIDERFFGVAEQDQGQGQFFRTRGIEIWDYDKEKKRFKALKNRWGNVFICEKKVRIPSIDLHYDFLLLHQSILEKVLESLKLSRSKQHTISILDSLSSHVKPKFKMIHTGRGKTEDPPAGWRFLTYSQLEAWFFEDKHSFVQGLYSVRGR